MAILNNFGLYTVNPDYLEFLYKIDSEVYYAPSYRKATKPFIGIVVLIDNVDYFIPLTSAKPKHLKWKNVSDQHFIIYEVVDNKIIKKGDLSKPYSETQSIRLLAVLDFKKMIPVPKTCYKPINFRDISDYKYVSLLKKEYQFCLSIKSKLLQKAVSLYNNQKQTGFVRKANCNFEKLEEALCYWKAHQLAPAPKSFIDDLKAATQAANKQRKNNDTSMQYGIRQ